MCNSKSIKKYIKNEFDIGLDLFEEVLSHSPGARGYLHGALSEILFSRYATTLNYEFHRIKEKPGGGYDAKSDEAKGDFYIRKNTEDKDEWFVVECKGVKSNAEKRVNLTEISTLEGFLLKHSFGRKNRLESINKSGKSAYEKKKVEWEKINSGKIFPSFNWINSNPGPGIPDLSNTWKNPIKLLNWIRSITPDRIDEDSYWNLTAPVRLLQTHMPSTRVDPNTKIKSTGPLKSEFNILAVDLFLRTGKHEFVFANSNQLNHQAKSPNHLQQNYTIDILVETEDFKRHPLLPPWYDNLDQCIKETIPVPRKLDKSQLDLR